MEALAADDPRQVGQFEIVARLGAGGMGRVYLARSASGEQFALKMIHQFLSDDVQFRRRFEREVMAARRVTGENTAALVDADPDARPPWMAVEYVEGPTLTELIEHGGPLTLGSCVRLASGMAAALISIHAVGLVHRDLKPSNVLMGAGGARLIDFGIAQASGASSLTMTGLVTGSAGFMSPEQAQAEHVTEASDVFALGTVLYFAATGQRPFGEGSMISITYRVVHAEVDLSGIRDEGLRELIADCLMKDPQRRPTPHEIYARCPGILDGTWQNQRSGATVQSFAVAAPSETGPMQYSSPQPHFQPPPTGPMQYPPAQQDYQPLSTGSMQYPAAQQDYRQDYQPLPTGPMQRPPAPIGYGGTPSRRDDRNGYRQPAGWRRYLTPWLALPAAGIIAMATAAAVIIPSLGEDDPGDVGTSGTEETGNPATRGTKGTGNVPGPQQSDGEAPPLVAPTGTSTATPSLGATPIASGVPLPVPTGKGVRPTTTPTASSTNGVKLPNVPATKDPDPEPDPVDPIPQPTTKPDEPVPSPTPPATTPPAVPTTPAPTSTSAGGGVGGGGVGGGAGNGGGAGAG